MPKEKLKQNITKQKPRSVSPHQKIYEIRRLWQSRHLSAQPRKRAQRPLFSKSFSQENLPRGAALNVERAWELQSSLNLKAAAFLRQHFRTIQTKKENKENEQKKNPGETVRSCEWSSCSSGWAVENIDACRAVWDCLAENPRISCWTCVCRMSLLHFEWGPVRERNRDDASALRLRVGVNRIGSRMDDTEGKRKPEENSGTRH